MKFLVITQKVDIDAPILGFFHRWLLEFEKRVEALSVICLFKGKNSLSKKTGVYSLGKERGNSKLAQLFNFYAIFTKLFIKKEFDGVFIHMNEIYAILLIPFYPLLKLRGIKVAFWRAHGYIGPMTKITAVLVDRIFTPTKESLLIKSKKLEIVGHGIDSDIFSPSKEKPASDLIRILSVGRISPSKGHLCALEALNILLKHKVKARLYIVGARADESDYGKLLLNYCKDNHLEKQVVFSGSINQASLAELYRESDFLINASKTGSLDKVVLEAMASGVIPISSNASIFVLLKDYPLSLFEEDNASDLAQKIKKHLNLSESQLKKLRKEFREIVIRDHNLSKLVMKITSYF